MHVSQAQQFFLDLPIKAARLQAWKANHVSTKQLHLRIRRDAGRQIARIHQNAKGLDSERKTHLEHSQTRDEFKDNYDEFSVIIMLDIREHGALRFSLPLKPF